MRDDWMKHRLGHVVQTIYLSIDHEKGLNWDLDFTDLRKGIYLLYADDP